MGAVGQTVMLLIMHTECIIHNRYTIKLIIIIIYKIKWPPCNFCSGKLRNRFLIPLLCYDLTASQMQLVYTLCVSVAFVQQRKCFCSDLPLETCFIVSSYLKSSPTRRLKRNSASGPNITSYWPPSSGPEVVLLCTYTRIHLLVPIRVNSFLVFFSLIHMLLQVLCLHLPLDGSIILSAGALKWEHLLMQKLM